MSAFAEEHIARLGEDLGLALKLEEGICTLMSEGEFQLEIRANEEEDALEISSVVASELPEGVGYVEMLELMNIGLGPLFGRPGLGRDPESGVIVLYAVLSATRVSPYDFAEAVKRFMELARALVARFRAWSENP